MLISAIGEVPELAPEPATSAPAGVGPGAEAEAEPGRVSDFLAQLFRGCMDAFPMSSVQAAPLGRPTPEQLDQAQAVPELLEAWEATGLLAVPQVRGWGLREAGG